MNNADELSWNHPTPYVIEWPINQQYIDHYQHVNNVAYISQMERVSWHHSHSLGLTIEDYQAIDRGMAIRKHEIEYHAAARLGDVLLCATWIVSCDKRLTLTRHFQFIRQHDNVTVFTAKTDFVCIALSSGRPKRMPDIFSKTYAKACIYGADK